MEETVWTNLRYYSTITQILCWTLSLVSAIFDIQNISKPGPISVISYVCVFGGRGPTQLGPREKARLNHWIMKEFLSRVYCHMIVTKHGVWIDNWVY
jgi:hypothetical protein